MALPWRNCNASMTLVGEVNAKWPNRDKASDGTIGDASHQSRTSDHNLTVQVGPLWVVRARDIDVDGVDMAWLMEHLRKLGAAGDPRLAGGGYLIFNRRITNPDFKAWRVYTGTNPHTGHGHVSFSTTQAGFDSTAPWGIATATAAPEDDMPTAREIADAILDTPITRQGDLLPPGPKTTTTLRNEVAYTTNESYRVANLAGQVAELARLVHAGGVDPAVVRAAVTAALGGGLDITGTAVPKKG